MRLFWIISGVGLLAAAAGDVSADPVFFVGHYEKFVEAAGDVQTIDFETLPDGSPSYCDALITPEFNYTNQGVTFFSQAPRLQIVGSSDTGFDLGAVPLQSDDQTRNWIIGELVDPAYAVGYSFGGNTMLSAFDEAGALIGSVSAQMGDFVGVVSDTEIALITCDPGETSAHMAAFVFAPVPEPASLVIITVGGIALVARCRRRLTRLPV